MREIEHLKAGRNSEENMKEERTRDGVVEKGLIVGGGLSDRC
jgi:hypothetical protein